MSRDRFRIRVHELGLEQVTAVQKGTHIDGYLQRRGQHVALSDGGVERVAAGPAALEAAVLPGPGGHEACLFMGQVDAGPAAKAALLREGLYLIDAEPVGHDVEVAVAGVVDGLHQVLRSVSAVAPAVKNLLAEAYAAGAVDGVCNGNAVFHNAGGHDELPDGARRVNALNGAVLQGKVRVVSEVFPVAAGNAFGEKVVVIGGFCDQGPELARVGLHDHDGSHLGAEGVPAGFLDVPVQGQFELLASLGFLSQNLAEHAARRVHFNVIEAFAAAQAFVQRVFDA